jgi:hypothetical protein
MIDGALPAGAAAGVLENGVVAASPLIQNLNISLSVLPHQKFFSYVRSSAHKELSYEVRNSIFCYLVHSPENLLL